MEKLLNNIPLIADNKLLKDNDISEISKILPLNDYINSQNLIDKATQCGIYTEYNICYSIIKYFNLSIKDIPESCRLYAENENMKFYYLGNPNQNDIKIIYNGIPYYGEIKEPLAKLEEKDLYYNEDGKLYFKSNTDKELYLPYIDFFNNTTDLFSNLGHNFKFEANDLLAYNIFSNKNVNFILSYDSNNNIICFNNTVENICRYIKFEGSEIRSTGRNMKNVFTPKYFNTILSNSLISQEGNIVFLDANKLTPVKGRGKNDITRYKLNECFAFKVEKILTNNNNIIKIKLNNIKQISPTISIHLQIRRDNENTN